MYCLPSWDEHTPCAACGVYEARVIRYREGADATGSANGAASSPLITPYRRSLTHLICLCIMGIVSRQGGRINNRFSVIYHSVPV